MPRKKLTLSVEPDLIEAAKKYARENDTSLSALVSAFLASLRPAANEVSPGVAELTGLIGPDVNEHQYKEYLVEKYLDN